MFGELHRKQKSAKSQGPYYAKYDTMYPPTKVRRASSA